MIQNNNLSLIASGIAILASIASPLIFIMNMKGDIRIANLNNENLSKQVEQLQKDLAEIRKAQYEAAIRINRNSAIVKKLDTTGSITKQVMALDTHKGVK